MKCNTYRVFMFIWVATMLAWFFTIFCLHLVNNQRDEAWEELYNINDGGYSHGFKIPSEPKR